MVDVCIILEGTYPYSTGGVSKWVHNLIKYLEHLDFLIIHLHSGGRREIKFEIPKNVKAIVDVDVRNGLGFKFDFSDLLDYVPEAKIYHSLSTGFAGLLGLQLKVFKNKIFLLTEHGLYWKELELGVNEVECGFKIYSSKHEKEKACVERRRYLEIFKNIAYKCYLSADAVVTVCRYNLEQQLNLVSEKGGMRDFNSKFYIIENFVEPEFYRFSSGIEKLHKTISFIGRVVEIKDVKTFIRSMPLILKEIDKAKFFIVGDLAQDPDYSRECLELVESLGLTGRVVFTGEANSLDYLKMTDVLVLPSKSEAQPFIVLEAMAMGVPVVATPVGGVVELISEKGFESGLLFDVGDHVKLAENVTKILKDDALRIKLSENGIKKAKRFTIEKFIKHYNQLYSKFLRDIVSVNVENFGSKEE